MFIRRPKQLLKRTVGLFNHYTTEPISTVIHSLVKKVVSASEVAIEEYYHSHHHQLLLKLYPPTKVDKMSATNLINGTEIAATIRAELKNAVDALKAIDAEHGTPGLAVVLVGSRRDSATYVRMKKKACAEVGVNSIGVDLPVDVPQEDLIKAVDELNSNPLVDGILVQLPLPPHIDEAAVLSRVSQGKDVDGLHPLNVAQLANTKTHGGRSSWADFNSLGFHIACTPQGCIELLDRSNVSIEGKEAVVLGRSNIVGIPVALLLMQRNATVTIAHSRTKNLEDVIRRADIVVAAVGRACMVKGSWLKAGAVVIDVGINSVDDASDKRGYRLVGDVDFESAKEVAGLITPVPGGVGPMTIAMLLRNTVNACRRRMEAAAAAAATNSTPAAAVAAAASSSAAEEPPAAPGAEGAAAAPPSAP